MSKPPNEGDVRAAVNKLNQAASKAMSTASQVQSAEDEVSSAGIRVSSTPETLSRKVGYGDDSYTEYYSNPAYDAAVAALSRAESRLSSAQREHSSAMQALSQAQSVAQNLLGEVRQEVTGVRRNIDAVRSSDWGGLQEHGRGFENISRRDLQKLEGWVRNLENALDDAGRIQGAGTGGRGNLESIVGSSPSRSSGSTQSNYMSLPLTRNYIQPSAYPSVDKQVASNPYGAGSPPYHSNKYASTVQKLYRGGYYGNNYSASAWGTSNSDYI